MKANTSLPLGFQVNQTPSKSSRAPGANVLQGSVYGYNHPFLTPFIDILCAFNRPVMLVIRVNGDAMAQVCSSSSFSLLLHAPVLTPCLKRLVVIGRGLASTVPPSGLHSFYSNDPLLSPVILPPKIAHTLKGFRLIEDPASLVQVSTFSYDRDRIWSLMSFFSSRFASDHERGSIYFPSCAIPLDALSSIQ
jgi:hypothetical protein